MTVAAGPDDREGAKATRDALRLVLISSAAQFAVLALNFVLRDQLGPEGMGYMALAFLALTYASYVGLGVMQAAEREVPVRLGAGDPHGADKIESAALAISLVAAIVLGAVIVAVTFVSVGTDDALLVATIAVSTALLVVQQPVLLGVIRLRTRLRFKALAAANAAISLGSVTIPVLGAAAWGIYGALFGALAASVLAAAGLFLLTTPRLMAPSSAALTSLTRLGPGFLASNLATLLLLSIDQLAIVFLLGTTSLGIYSAALLGRNLLLALPTIVGSVVYPRLQFELGATSDPGAVYGLTRRTTGLLAISVPVITGMAIILLPAIVEAALPAFGGAVEPLRVLLASAGALAFGIPASSYLVTINRQWQEAAISVVAVIVLILVAALVAGDGLDLLEVAVAVAAGATCHGLAMQLRAASLARRPIRTVARAASVHFAPIATVVLVGLVTGRLIPDSVYGQVLVAALSFAVLVAVWVPLAYLLLRSDAELRSDLSIVVLTVRRARW